MKWFPRLLLVLLACTAASCSRSETATINGAGASFPYPIYARWAHSFYQLNGTRINYQSIGSSAGITQVKSRTVSFGASDAPLTEKELDESGLIQFPMVIGGVVPVIHIEGIKAGELKLSPEVLARIYLGEIKSWNDDAVQQLNGDLKLPNQSITPVRRSDGSGTTWIFTSYLSEVYSPWKEKIGVGKEVAWPTGVGGKGNEGVATNVRQIDGAIGYVEYTYSVQNGMAHALLKNKAGKFAEPTIESFEAAAASADWAAAPGFYLTLLDQPGDNAWPITGASFILMHKDQPDPAAARAMLKFFDWCFRHGADTAKELHFVPLTSAQFGLVESLWDKQVTVAGKPVER